MGGRAERPRIQKFQGVFKNTHVSNVILFRGHLVVVPAAVIRWILDVERRGGRFTLTPDNAWRVRPWGVLTFEDLRFIVSQHRTTQIRHAIEHLTDEGSYFTA